MTVKIICDHRESEIIKRLLREKADVKEKQLPIGDFIVSKRSVVERKTANDFLQSIVDGRLFSQLHKMKKFEKPVFILEGLNIFNNERNIHPNAIRGALSSIALDFSIPLVWTREEKETAEMVLMFARREQEKQPKPVPTRFKNSRMYVGDHQKFLVSGLPSISTMLSERLLRKFRTPENVFTASEEELMKVQGIGKEKAKRIRHLLTRYYRE
jgi:Fanconi anemia group M protein